MNKRAIQTVLVVMVVALAGCLGGVGGQLGTDDDSTDDDTIEPNSETQIDDGEMGALTFYVSDEPNQIGDFEHLNVTITEVGLKTAGNGADDGGDADGDGNETESGSQNDSTTDADSDVEEPDDSPTVNETEATNDTETTPDTQSTNESSDFEPTDAGWIEYDVDDQTVDLTELQGANATALDVLEVPAGEYETVFIHVGEIEGILTDGTETDVKLPSEKLHVHTTFSVEAGSELDFVFDIAPHEAGNSGKYILKPVISQTGTGDDVEIRDIDGDDEEHDETATSDEDVAASDADESEVAADDEDRDDGEDGSDETESGDGGSNADNPGNGSNDTPANTFAGIV